MPLLPVRHPHSAGGAFLNLLPFFGSHYFCFSREASGKCGVHTSFFLDSAGGGRPAASQASEAHALRSSSEEGAGLAGRKPALFRPSGPRTVGVTAFTVEQGQAPPGPGTSLPTSRVPVREGGWPALPGGGVL